MNPREQATEAIRAHGWMWKSNRSEYVCLGCDWRGDLLNDHDVHVAEVVVEALGLTEEWGFGEPDDTEPESWFSGDQQWPDPEAQAIQAANGRALFRRWVSGWSVVGGEPSE